MIIQYQEPGVGGGIGVRNPPMLSAKLKKICKAKQPILTPFSIKTFNMHVHVLYMDGGYSQNETLYR